MKLKGFTHKDRYGNSMSFEFFESDSSVPSMDEIPFPGNPRGTDTVPTWLTPGENVINAEASRLPGVQPMLDQLNEKGRDIQEMQGGPIPTYAAEGDYITPQFLQGDQLESILDGMHMVESSAGKNVKTSEAGAVGEYQILPSTAMNPGMGIEPIDPSDLNDPAKSRDFAGKYLQAIHKNNPNFSRSEVITAYHSGVGNVRKAKDGVESLGPRGQEYANKVLMASPYTGSMPTPKPETMLAEADTTPAIQQVAAADIPPANANAAVPEPSFYEQLMGNLSSAASAANELNPFRVTPAGAATPPSDEFVPSPTPLEAIDELSRADIQNADFNLKAVQGNLANKETELRAMEAQRLANLEADRDEFTGINKFTYQGLQRDVENLKKQVINRTETAGVAAGNNPAELETIMEQQRIAIRDAGKPSDAEIAVINSPEYQAILNRAGAEAPPPADFIRDNTPDENGVTNNDRKFPASKDGNQTNEKAVTKVIEETSEPVVTESPGNDDDKNKAQGVLDNNPNKEAPPIKEEEAIEAAQNEDPTIFENFAQGFKDLFAEMFNPKELARMAVLYAGSRAMGYEHGGSINFAVKQYVNRIDQAATQRAKDVRSTTFMEAFTKESLDKYSKTGRREDLVEKAPAAVTVDKQKGSTYIKGLGMVNVVTMSNKKDAVLINGRPVAIDTVVNKETGITLADIMEPVDKEVHSPVKVAARFDGYADEAVKRVNSGKQDDDPSKVPDNSKRISKRASTIFNDILLRNGASLSQAESLEDQMAGAIDDYYDAVATADPKPTSVDAFVERRMFAPLTGLSQGLVSTASAETLRDLNQDIYFLMENKDKRDPKFNQEYQAKWRTIHEGWKALPSAERSKFMDDADKDKNKGHSGFTLWMSSLKETETE